MRFATALFIFLVALVMLELSGTSPSSGTRRRSSSGSKGTRRRSSSTSKGTRRRSSSNSRGSGSKTKITKYTPIEPTTFRSPVIVSQAKLGSSRSSMFNKAVAGYFVYSYIGQLSRAPVFRQGYPMYRNDVSIPKNRAIRVSYEEEKLMDIQGNLCLGNSSRKGTLREGIDDELVELNTTIKYRETGITVKYQGINNTVSLEDIKGQDFEVRSRALYNTSIVAETNCSQVEKRVEGTMVEMYETNPNSARVVSVNYSVLLASIAMAGFIDLFKTT